MSTNLFLPGFITLCLIYSTPSQAVEINLYGLGHLSADQVDDGQDSSPHLASNSSRLGFYGSQKISSDASIIFQYETGADLTAQGINDGNGGANSSGQIFTKGRPSFVGIKVTYGQILIGHMPALDQWANDYNLFADQVGDLGNLWEGSGLPGRSDNVLQYTTPEKSGLKAVISYMPEEGVDDSDNLIIKADYVANDLKLGLAYATVGQGSGLDDHRAIAFTAGYEFGLFSIGGGYQTETDILGVSGDDRDSLSLGASMKVGQNGRVKLQWANSEGDGPDSDATQVAVGYDYFIGDNLTLYVAYAQTDNDANVSFSANGKGHGDKVVPLAGDDPDALSLGIVYKFDIGLWKN